MVETAHGRSGDGAPNDHLFDRDLDHLPPEARWREWMQRVEATILAASEPVTRSVLARVVGASCDLDLLFDDIREKLRPPLRPGRRRRRLEASDPAGHRKVNGTWGLIGDEEA